MFGILVAMLACSEAPGPKQGPGDTAAEDSGEPAPQAPLLLSFPLPERERYDTVLGVDHDPVEQEDSVLGRATCTDYLGRSFPHCYDQHEGSDYILTGGFDAMDSGSSPILAAADGLVVSTEDGHYDRCHSDLAKGDVSCDGYEMIANHVILEHTGDDGSTWRTMYWHMKSGSVAVAVGDQVAEGTLLGLVGSSGYSSMPHLHLELHQVLGAEEEAVVDPYAGPYSQSLSYWCDQGGKDSLPESCVD